MVAMSRTTRLAIIFSAIAIAVIIGIMIASNQTLAGIFQLGASEDNENNIVPFDQSFAFTTKYQTTLAVGEEGTFNGSARNGKEPYKFEWKFSNGVALTGQNITHSFNSPGTYYFDLTVTDADGKQIKSGNLSLNVTLETPKEGEGEQEGTTNATSMPQHR